MGINNWLSEMTADVFSLWHCADTQLILSFGFVLFKIQWFNIAGKVQISFSIKSWYIEPWNQKRLCFLFYKIKPRVISEQPVLIPIISLPLKIKTIVTASLIKDRLVREYHEDRTEGGPDWSLEEHEEKNQKGKTQPLQKSFHYSPGKATHFGAKNRTNCKRISA